LFGTELDSGTEEASCQTSDLAISHLSSTPTIPDALWQIVFSVGPQVFLVLFSAMLIKPNSCSQVDPPPEGKSKMNGHFEESSETDGQPK
jgi:hypothetical protein